MILTIIALIVIVVGIVMVWKGDYDGLGLLLTVGVGLIAFIMAICIICAHVGVDVTI